MFNGAWGGLPAKEFLAKLHPKLGELRRRLYQESYTSDKIAGRLTPQWAGRLRLPAGIPVAVGAFDAHLGAVGAGVRPGRLVKIIGTSTCDIAVWPNTKPLADIPGLCGIVDGSVLPGYFGLEAGQSAVGDIFNWFVSVIQPGGAAKGSHRALTAKAGALRPGESGLLALDWNNGNRTILVDQRLTGLLLGQTLHTTPAEIYRALIEATAFGALTIINRFEEYGVKISEIVTCGGIAEKNALLMQVYADVTGREMRMARSGQTCALGSAVAGAVVAGKAGGGYDGFESAQSAMCGLKALSFRPDRAKRVIRNARALFRAPRRLRHQNLVGRALSGDERPPGHPHSLKKGADARRARQSGGRTWTWFDSDWSHSPLAMPAGSTGRRGSWPSSPAGSLTRR
jgi:L-ribulokinase